MIKKRRILCLLALLLCALCAAAFADTLYYTSDGVQGTVYIPSNQTPVTRPTPQPHTHSWSSWVTLREATCTQTGLRQRTCSGCGETQQDTIDKKDHRFGKWTTTKQSTCRSTGTRVHECLDCGYTASQSLKKLDHKPGAWEITKEPTCQHTGTRQARCTVCGAAIKEDLKKVAHRYGAWQITKEATDHSKGKRTSACVFCGKKHSEDFYPEGTLAPDLDNPPDKVQDLQSTLAMMGFLNAKPSGKYDKKTVTAVKGFQKRRGFKQDGICWPQTWNALGMGKAGEAITEDTQKFNLQLAVEQVSPKKEIYAEEDEITFQWTLTNAAKKSAAKNLRVYAFSGVTPPKNAEKTIAEPDDLAPGESVSGLYTYAVRHSDVSAEKFFNGFIAHCKFGKNNSKSNTVYFKNLAGKEEEPSSADLPVSASPEAVSPAGAGSGGWTPPSEYQLDIQKTVDKKPENTLYFVKGETIPFKITVSNTSAKSVKNVIVTDAMFPDLKGNIGTLASGAAKEFKLDYVVDAKDISPGEVYNEAVVSYTGADGKLKTALASVTAKTGMATDGLLLYKFAAGKPANGKFYLPGEEVKFTIILLNLTSKTFKNVKVYDWLSSKKTPFQTESAIGPYSSCTYEFKTKVTWLQAKHGKLINVVSAYYTDPDTGKTASVVNQRSVPTGFEGQDGVTVTKTVISEPKNGSYYQKDEEIRYLIEVHNNTVNDIHALAIRDSLAKMDDDGYRTIVKEESLKAGGTYSFHFQYVVSKEDVENTYVTNVASAAWATDKEEFLTYADPVTVPTAGKRRVRKPVPPAVEGKACKPILSAVGDGISWRDLTECEIHSNTASQSEIFVIIGDYDQADSAWDADIDRLYAEWIAKADAEGRLTAENEQAAFHQQMDAMAASLALVCDQKTARTLTAEERMNKCILLCYELHAAPEQRADSLSAFHTALPDAPRGAQCRHKTTYDEDAAHFIDDMCGEHTQTMQLTKDLLDQAQDAESRMIAWEQSQLNWTAELDHLYDVWYLSASEDQRPLIAADRMSFDTLISARREALADLYPDDPATAAEVLSNLIMTRTETMCRVLHEANILEE